MLVLAVEGSKDETEAKVPDNVDPRDVTAKENHSQIEIKAIKLGNYSAGCCSDQLLQNCVLLPQLSFTFFDHICLLLLTSHQAGFRH